MKFFEGIELKGVKELDLVHNYITDLGLKTLLRAIKNYKIKSISLQHNELKNSSIDYLISFSKYN